MQPIRPGSPRIWHANANVLLLVGKSLEGTREIGSSLVGAVAVFKLKAKLE